MSPRIHAATIASGRMSSTCTSDRLRLFVLRNPSSRKCDVEPNGVATFLPLKSAGVWMFAALRTVISSAPPMLSTRPTSCSGMPWLTAAATGEEPIASPISAPPARIAALISAPLPYSCHFTGSLVASSSRCCAFMIIVGLVSTKKARLICVGAAARATNGRASGTATAPAAAARRKSRLVMCILPPLPGFLRSGPVYHAPLRRDQQPVQDQAERADHRDADEHLVGAQKPAGVQDHPADPRAAGDDFRRDQRAVGDAERQPRAGEDRPQRRGQRHVQEDLRPVRAQRLRRAQPRL